MQTLKKLWKNEYIKTIVAIALIVAIVFAFFFGLQLALGTPVPVRVVESGSMCVPYGSRCDGWTSILHPFEHTLHKGDILIIQAVDPKDLKTDYPNSDIIIYKNPKGVTPIVHRIVSSQNINGTLYFKTKGDGNGPILWPDEPNYYDNIPDANGVPEDLIEGKVIMRIPWFGWITLFMRDNNWGLPIVISLIILLIIIEFVIPILREKKKPEQQISANPQL
ncbi:MAG: signal peptidase I [Candidatus Bathyarchaeota archaeon]|nr:signal peptidase I [Candidatus Bathyarchaeota archaeon]